MPRRGASSVVVSRSGIPEPRAVTGSLLRSVKVDRSIAEGPVAAPIPGPAVGRAATIVVGVLLAAAAFLVYSWSNPVHWNGYNHFVWQADAFLHGRAWFPYPVPVGRGPAPERLPPGRVPAPGRGGQPRRPGAAPVPAAAGAGPGAVRRAVRPGHGPGGRVDPARRPGRGAGLVDAGRAASCDRPSALPGRSSSPPAPCGGGRPPSAAPGTWPTWSRWTSPWSPSASRSATMREP